MSKLATIDAIGVLEDEIRALQAKVKKMKEKVIDYRGVGHYEGADYEGSVYEMDQTRWDMEKVKKLIEKAGKKVDAFQYKDTITCMRVEKKGKRALAAAKAVATKKAKAVRAEKDAKKVVKLRKAA